MVTRNTGFPATTKNGLWRVPVDGFPFDRPSWVVVEHLVPLAQPVCTGGSVDEDTMQRIMNMRDAWLRHDGGEW